MLEVKIHHEVVLMVNFACVLYRSEEVVCILISRAFSTLNKYTSLIFLLNYNQTSPTDSQVKGSQLGVFCSQTIVNCYLEFKLRYLKNLKLFSIRVKELFTPIVLRRKGDGFLLFLNKLIAFS